jgi:hypothetical protein
MSYRFLIQSVDLAYRGELEAYVCGDGDIRYHSDVLKYSYGCGAVGNTDGDSYVRPVFLDLLTADERGL